MKSLSATISAMMTTVQSSGRRLAFDAHNHVHLSLEGGIPPLPISSKDYNVITQEADGDNTTKEYFSGLEKDYHENNYDIFDNLTHQIARSLAGDCTQEKEIKSKETTNIRSTIRLRCSGMALMSTQPRDFPIVDYIEEDLSSVLVPLKDNQQDMEKRMQSVTITDNETKADRILFKTIKAYGVHPWFLHQADLDFVELSNLKLQNNQEHDNDDVNNDVSQEFDWVPYLRYKLMSSPQSCVGEIGLDGARYDPITKDLPSPMDRQVKAFEVQMHMAADFKRAVSIHAVKAWGPLTDAFRRIKAERRAKRKLFKKQRRSVQEANLKMEKGTKGDHSSSEDDLPLLLPPRIYFHAFGGKTAVVDQLDALCRDCSSETFYGFAPVINFRSPKTASLIQKIGISQLVLESDLEDYRNVVGDLSANVDFIADALEMDRDSVLEATYNNTKRLYVID